MPVNVGDLPLIFAKHGPSSIHSIRMLSVCGSEEQKEHTSIIGVLLYRMVHDFSFSALHGARTARHIQGK